MPAADRAPQTLYDKVLQAHIVDEKLDGTLLLYIGSYTFISDAPILGLKSPQKLTIRPFHLDRHIVHEVTSPQAFEGLKNAGRKVRRPDCTLATTDHVRPFLSPSVPFPDT